MNGMMWIRVLITDSTNSKTDLDSHVDTGVVGKYALILRDYDRPESVSGYDPTKKSQVCWVRPMHMTIL